MHVRTNGKMFSFHYVLIDYYCLETQKNTYDKGVTLPMACTHRLMRFHLNFVSTHPCHNHKMTRQILRNYLYPPHKVVSEWPTIEW